jgi:K+-sensing histidine kinase KdpD
MQNSLDYNKFFTDLNIAEQLKVEEDLGSGYVKLKISESERRQALQDIKCVEDIVVELLRNSRDAGSKNIFIATKKTAEKRRLIYCIDDGRGIPQKFHNLIFQSRVTSKLEDGTKDLYGFHGRGMALFSIKLNVEDVRIIYSDLKKGTCMLVDVDLEKIPEKKDQSALPHVTKNNDTYDRICAAECGYKLLLWQPDTDNSNINRQPQELDR